MADCAQDLAAAWLLRVDAVPVLACMRLEATPECRGCPQSFFSHPSSLARPHRRRSHHCHRGQAALQPLPRSLIPRAHHLTVSRAPPSSSFRSQLTKVERIRAFPPPSPWPDSTEVSSSPWPAHLGAAPLTPFLVPRHPHHPEAHALVCSTATPVHSPERLRQSAAATACAASPFGHVSSPSSRALTSPGSHEPAAPFT
jgi:hypothetical protein